MIIQSSDTRLSSARVYSSKSYSAQMTQRLSGLGAPSNVLTSDSAGTRALPDFFAYLIEGDEETSKKVVEDEVEEKEESKDHEEEQSLSDMVKRFQNTQAVKSTSVAERIKQLNKIRSKTLDYLLEVLFGKKRAMPIEDSWETVDTAEAGSIGIQTQQFRQTSYFHYEENESVSFAAQGKVVTADGREMDLNFEMNLSRSFVMETREYYDYSAPVFCDPLVIQLDGSMPSVSDMKFFFDLDADGEEEEISLLGQGNGFLALDQNEDGIINDGSELFGTRSGNGFHDLERYDVDRNGWIDEADEIFDKLRIWMKQEDGTDKLLTLKEAGVGAIHLGSIDTQFAYNNEDNVTNAMARRSGFFLYENGGTGSLQQLDMAT